MTGYSHNADCVTPVMTSNNGPAPFKVFSSIEAAGTEAFNAFNQSASGGGPWYFPIDDAPQWIGVDVGAGNYRSITSYTLTAASNNASFPGMPTAWTLQGSIDGASWSTIESQSGQTGWGNSEMRTYTLGSTSAFFRFFRLYMSAKEAGAAGWQIYELEFIGTAYYSEPCIPLSRGNRNEIAPGFIQGGTVKRIGNSIIHTFLADGPLVVLSGMRGEILLVAGGGGGGGHYTNEKGGSGGGAGGIFYRPSFWIPAGTYSITIGQGGSAGGTSANTWAGVAGGKGTDTTLGSLLKAEGGGAGCGGFSGGDKTHIGGPGGSGGGGGRSGVNGGASSTCGAKGGYGTAVDGGSGGGGAGANGTGATSAAGASGGDGLACSISGESVTYAGGGGGGAYSGSGGAGGTGGGGAGGNANADGVAGTANRGGGGGGAGGGANAARSGQPGGSGIAIIRYQVVPHSLNMFRRKAI